MTSPNPRQRKLPFLHRNWLTGVIHLTAISSKPSAQVHDGDDDNFARPTKRRRVADDSPDSGIGPDINALVLPEEPGETQRALRIEVLKIIHKDSSRVRNNGIFNGNTAPATKDIANIKARCRITITSRKPGEPRMLHSDSQICTIKTFKNPVGPSRMARVYLPQPFNVPEEKIFIERDDDSVFDLADAYTVAVELESAGDPNWPPLSLLNLSRDEDIFGHPSPRQWTLKAEVANIYCQPRSSSALRLKKASQRDSLTDYIMDIDTRWTTGLPENAILKRLEKDVMPEITVFNPFEEPKALANGLLGNDHVIPIDDDVDEDMEGEPEGELTPSRSLRMKKTKTYNLKVLSAQAQGKEPRKRSKLLEPKKAKDDHVFYLLPKLPEPIREIVVDDFACCICHATNQSTLQLRAHLLSHAQYNFEFSDSDGRDQITVSLKPSNASPLTRPKIYQLGRPNKRTPFDLKQYVEGNGNDPWVTSRLGPLNETLQKSVLQAPQVKPSPRPYARRKEKTKQLLVPVTKQPLYDPLSKAELVPGTEVRQPFADDTWLIQKHRDTVHDYSDVNPAEKEYMKEWDAFIIKKRISSDAYVARAFSEFVKEKAYWLVASQSRVEEFGKHLSVLTARAALDDQTIQDAVSRVQDARGQKPLVPGKEKDKDKLKESPKEAQYRSSKGCAVCGRPVRGPSILICANEDCEKPLYHDDCIREEAKMPVKDFNWCCNDCFPRPA